MTDTKIIKINEEVKYLYDAKNKLKNKIIYYVKNDYDIGEIISLLIENVYLNAQLDAYQESLAILKGIRL